MNKKLLNYLYCGIVTLMFYFGVVNYSFASIINGTVDSTNHSAQVCENDACTTTPTSEINFGYFTTPQDSYNVHLTDTELTGLVWGESFGWVVLNCINTTSGCSSTNGNFKVANTSNGSLSGYGWGENAGWINFGPFVNNSATTVVINSTGQFNGYAWSQNYGWIKFDCSDPLYCVQTDWRPATARPECSDGVDNDSDGKIDALDTGCINSNVYDPTDNTEAINHSGGSGSGSSSSTSSSSSSSSGDGNSSSSSSSGDGNSSSSSGDGNSSSTSSSSGDGNSSSSSSSSGDGNGSSSSSGDGGGSSSSGGGGSSSSSGGGFFGNYCQLNPDNIACLPPSEIFDKKIAPAVNAVKKVAKDFITKPVGEKVTQTVSTVGVVSGVAVSVASGIFLNPLSFSELFLIPFRLWALLMAALGLKKKNRPWGTVYDSVTKQPLDPAYVILKNEKGEEVSTSITDLDGRYGFLIGPGTYTILASKTNYKFPSEKMAGKNADELYNDLYFGDNIIINNEGEVIAKNVPLDPLKFDWNEFAKKDQNLMKFYSNRQKIISVISNVLFIFGFGITIVAVIVAPKTYNIITLVMYVILFILKKTILRPKLQGSVIDKNTNNPLSFTIVRIFSSGTRKEVIHKITDKVGKYYCLIPNGTYFVTLERKKIDGSYELIYTSNSIEVTKGYLYTDFKV